jgi:hypothetical protein
MLAISAIIVFVSRDIAVSPRYRPPLRRVLARMAGLVVPAFAFLTCYLLLVILFGSLYAVMDPLASSRNFRLEGVVRAISFPRASIFRRRRSARSAMAISRPPAAQRASSPAPRSSAAFSCCCSASTRSSALRASAAAAAKASDLREARGRFSAEPAKPCWRMFRYLLESTGESPGIRKHDEFDLLDSVMALRLISACIY